MSKRQDQSRQPTILDVAAAAGVSRATAARALGGYGSVSEATRARVKAAAADLRYRPNTLARSMATGATRSLGVVIADIENPFFARAVRGIADTAHAAGFEVILANSDEDVDEERTAVSVLFQKRVDGLIVAPASTTETRHLVEVVEAGVPVVLLDRGSPAVPADAVVVDNERAAQGAIAHLARLGHRRIAIVMEEDAALNAAELETTRPGPTEAMPSTLRLVGWAAGLRAFGLPVVEEMIRRTAYNRAAAAQQTIAALELDDPATAIFTTDSTMTLGAVDGIVASGRQMPDDVSLVSFDDLEWTTLVRPPLTVVAQPVYEVGATATRLLLARLAGDDRPPQTVILDTTFILRGSTGRAPGT
jgi:LacI family transcriptional regulator